VRARARFHLRKSSAPIGFPLYPKTETEKMHFFPNRARERAGGERERETIERARETRTRATHRKDTTASMGPLRSPLKSPCLCVFVLCLSVFWHFFCEALTCEEKREKCGSFVQNDIICIRTRTLCVVESHFLYIYIIHLKRWLPSSNLRFRHLRISSFSPGLPPPLFLLPRPSRGSWRKIF
jgi:hypothetical protein